MSPPDLPPAAAPSVDAWAFTDMITRLRRVLRAAIRSDYPWETLPMAQIEILQRLAEEPNLRVRDLAERHRLATNTISNLIQQMVTAGLVSRSPDTSDRRAVTICLTAAGQHALHGWLAAHEQRFHRALDALSGTDRRKIATALPALSRLVVQLELADLASHCGQGESDQSAGALDQNSVLVSRRDGAQARGQA